MEPKNRVGQSATALQPLPRILTKKEIMVRVGICHTSHRRFRQLRRYVITDSVLEAIGLTDAEYRRRQTFTVQESDILAKLLSL